MKMKTKSSAGFCCLFMTVVGVLLACYAVHLCRPRREHFLDILASISDSVNCNADNNTTISPAWSDAVTRTTVCTHRTDICESRTPGKLFDENEVKSIVSILDVDTVSCISDSCVDMESNWTKTRQQINACQFIINDIVVRVTRQCQHLAVESVTEIQNQIGVFDVSFIKTSDVIKRLLVPRVNIVKTAVALYTIRPKFVSLQNKNEFFACLSKKYEKGFLFNGDKPPQHLASFYGTPNILFSFEQDNKDAMLATDDSIYTEFKWNEARQLNSIVILKMSSYYISQAITSWSYPSENVWASIGTTFLAKPPFVPFAFTIQTNFSIPVTITNPPQQVMNNMTFFSVGYQGKNAIGILTAIFVSRSECEKQLGLNVQNCIALKLVGDNFELLVYVPYGEVTLQLVVTNTFVHAVIVDEDDREYSVYTLKNCSGDFIQSARGDGNVQVKLEQSNDVFKTSSFKTCYGIEELATK